MKLTRTDIAGLAAAGQRQDHLVPPPDALSAGARRAALTRLLRAGVAEEVAVADEALGWRMEAQSPVGLRITAAGLAALELPEAPVETPQGDAPRPTKRAIVIALLARAEGARMGELVAATGWLPHTPPAPLSPGCAGVVSPSRQRATRKARSTASRRPLRSGRAEHGCGDTLQASSL